MIKYTLKCSKDHRFDSWFQSAAAFEKLLDAGMVACSVCGVSEVEKAIMAPQIRTKRPAAPAQTEPAKQDSPLSEPASPAEQALGEMRKMVEETSEDVGENFVSEARAIHDGDAPERPIYGQAKIEEAKELAEEGIPVVPLPWGNKRTN